VLISVFETVETRAEDSKSTCSEGRSAKTDGENVRQKAVSKTQTFTGSPALSDLFRRKIIYIRGVFRDGFSHGLSLSLPGGCSNAVVVIMISFGQEQIVNAQSCQDGAAPVERQGVRVLDYR